MDIVHSTPQTQSKNYLADIWNQLFVESPHVTDTLHLLTSNNEQIFMFYGKWVCLYHCNWILIFFLCMYIYTNTYNIYIYIYIYIGYM